MTALLALLRKLPVTVYLYAVIALGVVAGYASFVHTQREIGRREVLLAQAETARREAVHRADSLEKAFKRDTVIFNKWRTRWDTIVHTDSQWIHDTLPVPVKVVKELVYVADTTIKACTQALNTCNQRVGAEKTARLAAEEEVKILKKSIPSTFTIWRDRTIAAAIGFTLSRAITK